MLIREHNDDDVDEDKDDFEHGAGVKTGDRPGLGGTRGRLRTCNISDLVTGSYLFMVSRKTKVFRTGYRSSEQKLKVRNDNEDDDNDDVDDDENDFDHGAGVKIGL